MAVTHSTSTTPGSTAIETAVTAIVSANPDINPDEARRVVSAVARMRETQQAADTFVELAAGRVAAAGSNACGGGSNACGGGKFA
jgi:hypothetical protein